VADDDAASLSKCLKETNHVTDQIEQRVFPDAFGSIGLFVATEVGATA
jgi:hypothetical protein